MGVGTSSKSIFVYCCLYLVKVFIYSCYPPFLYLYSFWFCFQNSAAVLSIVSLLHDAKVHTEKYPSHAVDSGSAERNTIHLMTRILNSMSSSCEYSATQAVGTALGLQAQFCMHKRAYLYADQAIDFVIERQLQLYQPNSDDIPDDPSVASSFSSGVYSDHDSLFASSDSDEPEDPKTSAQPVQCVSSIEHPKTSAKPVVLSQDLRASSMKDPKTSAQPVVLSQDEEFGPSTDADGLQLSDTDSDVDVSTHQRIDSLLRRGTIRHGSVAVTRNTTGQLCVVTQAEDYMYRPEEFKSFSLYEMVCMTYRREISRKTKEPSTSDSDSSNSSNSSSDEKSNVEDVGQRFFFISNPRIALGRHTHLHC